MALPKEAQNYLSKKLKNQKYRLQTYKIERLCKFSNMKKVYCIQYYKTHNQYNTFTISSCSLSSHALVMHLIERAPVWI
jgi:hypothetical protein